MKKDVDFFISFMDSHNFWAIDKQLIHVSYNFFVAWLNLKCQNARLSFLRSFLTIPVPKIFMENSGQKKNPIKSSEKK